MDAKAQTRNVDLLRNILRRELLHAWISFQDADRRTDYELSETMAAIAQMQVIRDIAESLQIKLGDEQRICDEAKGWTFLRGPKRR